MFVCSEYLGMIVDIFLMIVVLVRRVEYGLPRYLTTCRCMTEDMN